eukprot:Nk52_evm43s236 gene=Nk52_evmTU43s236
MRNFRHGPAEHHDPSSLSALEGRIRQIDRFQSTAKTNYQLWLELGKTPPPKDKTQDLWKLKRVTSSSSSSSLEASSIRARDPKMSFSSSSSSAASSSSTQERKKKGASLSYPTPLSRSSKASAENTNNATGAGKKESILDYLLSSTKDGGQ